MKRRLSLAIFTVLTLAMVVVQHPLDACQSCRVKIICTFTTDCEVFDICRDSGELGIGFTDCWIDAWGNCTTGGEVCRWA